MEKELTSHQLQIRDQILQVLGTQDVAGQCVRVTKFFAPIFHLAVVEGLCNGEFHVWCEDAEGNIIDPTAEQFAAPRRYFKLQALLDDWATNRLEPHPAS